MLLVAAVLSMLALSAAPALADVEKVTICHKPGTPAEQTKEVPESAVPGHLGHGDTLGACEGDGGGGEPGPPGNDGNDGKNGHDGRDGRDANFDGLIDDLFDAIEAPSFEQDATSGDLTQSVNIGGGNDNSNICVAPQLVGNTGNAQSQFAGQGDADHVGSGITVSPINATSCSQSVNQTAFAV